MAEKKDKNIAEKTGEVAGKAGKEISDGTKSFVKGIKRGFGKKEEKKE